MGNLSIGEKARRIVSFIIGLGNEHVQGALAPHGFTEDDLHEGMRLLSDLTGRRLGMRPGVDPHLLGKIDGWENRWFPIVEVVLRTNYPDVHAVVFRNLTQTSGSDVIVSVPTLLDRLDAIAKPVEEGGLERGREARARLEKRGLTEEVVAEARALIARVGTVPATRDPLARKTPEAVLEAEERAWNWYLEWSGIARVVLSDRRILRSLGFLRSVRRTDGTEVDVIVTDEDVDTDTPIPTPEPTPVEPEPTLVGPEPSPIEPAPTPVEPEPLEV